MRKLSKQEFIERSLHHHGSKYDLSDVNFLAMSKPIAVTCPIHGEFIISARSFSNGKGCQKCAIESRNNKLSTTYETFIAKANQLHSHRNYDYSKVDIHTFKLSTRITIVCPIHGEFTQIAANHLGGSKCPKCITMTDKKKAYLEKLKTGIRKKGHDYWSKAVSDKLAKHPHISVARGDLTQGVKSDITYTCSKHGITETISLDTFMYRENICNACALEVISKKNSTVTYEEFIERSNAVHTGKNYQYLYPSEYYNLGSKLTIVCPTHGEFKQYAGHHVSGCGCPKCGIERRSELFSYVSSQEDTLYHSLSGLGYSVLRNKTDIIFPLEIDLYLPDYKLAIEVNGVYWHSTKFKDSQYHINKLNICESNGITLLQFYDTEIVNDLPRVLHVIENTIQRKHIRPVPRIKLDRNITPVFSVYLPETQSTQPEVIILDSNEIYNSGYFITQDSPKVPGAIVKHVFYDSELFDTFVDSPDLPMFYSDEVHTKYEIIDSMLTVRNGTANRIYARKCDIRELDSPTAKRFTDKSHITGHTPASVYLGLYYDDSLVALMSFKKPRFTKKYTYELVRYCNTLNTVVVGGASKLFRYFIENYCTPGNTIISYANKRYSLTGNMYTKIGFTLAGESQPNYFYIRYDGKKVSRYSAQKHKLSKILPIYDSSLSEYQNMRNNNYQRNYDRGNFVFEYTVR